MPYSAEQNVALRKRVLQYLRKISHQMWLIDLKKISIRSCQRIIVWNSEAKPTKFPSRLELNFPQSFLSKLSLAAEKGKRFFFLVFSMLPFLPPRAAIGVEYMKSLVGETYCILPGCLIIEHT